MQPMIRLALALVILGGMLAPTAAARAQDAGGAPVDPSKPAADPAAQARLAEAVAPSLVRVEYTLRFDKGEPPTSAGWTTRCAGCGQFHGTDVSQVVQEDRPFEAPGFLVGADEVVTADPMIHPRFIRKVAVTFGGQTVDATPAKYARKHNAITLKLGGPLKDARPLPQFAGAGKDGPFSAVTYSQEAGVWTVTVVPLGGAVSTTADGRRFTAAPSPAVVVAPDGMPIALSMNGELPLDGSWKGPPAAWPSVTAEELAKTTDVVREATANGLLRVTLNLRSPRASPQQQMFSRGRGGEDDDATVKHVTGVLLDERTVLVLAELKANVTARLEKVRVRPAKGEPVDAKFSHTLTDYGAFVATLDKPLPGALPPATLDLKQARGVLLPAAQVVVQGEKRTEYFGHRRISGFNTGFRRQLYPEVAGENGNVFLFDESGALVALPVTRRVTVSLQERWGNDSQPLLTPASYLRQVVTDVPKTADAGNVPLSEEEENRLAWLGVELQGLNPELARANEVSHLTNDGQSGALVTHVYPGSPAAEAGVEPGWILIRAHVEGEPKPLEVTVEPHPFADQAFPWDRFDDLPEQVFDRIPQPWPPAENSLTRALTDLGFGRSFEAEFFHDGKVEQKSFKVSQSPAHYGSAPKFKLDPLGVTVRDMTYEVRRYFQREAEEPGVIISKIEMGSKASTSGLKPFELVTHVNDQPVANVKDFEKFTKDQQELRLSVRRMAKGRQVKVKLAAKDAKDAKDAKPAAAKEDAPKGDADTDAASEEPAADAEPSAAEEPAAEGATEGAAEAPPADEQ